MLIAANLVPLLGVVWFGWDVTTVLLAYWLENGIVGLLNVPKMLLATGTEQPLSAVGAAAGIGGRVALTLFFMVHYGIFWVVHGVFVIVFAGGALTVGSADPAGRVLADDGLLLAAAGLLASHAVSFWLNYIGRGEYRNASLGGQMFAPYPRMVVLHLTIVVGGAVLIGMGQPVVLVALLVVFKTVVDLGLHVAERRRQGGRPAPATV